MNRQQFEMLLAHSATSEALTESPIERSLHWAITKFLHPGVDLTDPDTRPPGRLVPQVNIPTLGGRYRGDLLLYAPDQITLIECDGAAFHSDPFDDQLRSAFILHTGLVDQVIRFNGSMLHHSPDDGALLTAAVAPAAFMDHARGVLERKATPEGVEVLRSSARDLASGYAHLRYSADVEDPKSSVDADGLYPSRSATFECTYDHKDATRGRVSEMLQLLREDSSSSPDELEKRYWALQKENHLQRTYKLRSDIQRKVDAQSGPFTRELFDERWLILLDRFQSTPHGTPDEYFAALAPLRYAGQFERAFNIVFRYDTFFPTPQRLLEAAYVVTFGDGDDSW